VGRARVRYQIHGIATLAFHRPAKKSPGSVPGLLRRSRRECQGPPASQIWRTARFSRGLRPGPHRRKIAPVDSVRVWRGVQHGLPALAGVPCRDRRDRDRRACRYRRSAQSKRLACMPADEARRVCWTHSIWLACPWRQVWGVPLHSPRLSRSRGGYPRGALRRARGSSGAARRAPSGGSCTAPLHSPRPLPRRGVSTGVAEAKPWRRRAAAAHSEECRFAGALLAAAT
jgi:hypothetical protein